MKTKLRIVSLSYKIFYLIKELAVRIWKKIPVFMIWGNGASEEA